MDKNRAKVVTGVAILIWFLILTTGTTMFMRYENKPGVAASVPSQFPAHSSIQPATDRPTLIMLAHPRCPCTRASIRVLSRIAAVLAGRIAIYVVFVKPAGSDKDWEKSDLWTVASAIPDASVMSDDQGMETKRFDSYTSGQTVLYDRDGATLFSGGITAIRGQEGDSLGADSIISLVNGKGTQAEATNVYGCPLFANEKGEAIEKEVVNAN